MQQYFDSVWCFLLIFRPRDVAFIRLISFIARHLITIYQRNVVFLMLENEFENIELTHETRLGMDGKALGKKINFLENYLNCDFLFSKF